MKNNEAGLVASSGPKLSKTGRLRQARNALGLLRIFSKIPIYLITPILDARYIIGTLSTQNTTDE